MGSGDIYIWFLRSDIAGGSCTGLVTAGPTKKRWDSVYLYVMEQVIKSVSQFLLIFLLRVCILLSSKKLLVFALLLRRSSQAK